MLTEWIRSLTTPCPIHLREMGYLREVIALSAGHKRCKTAWRPHLQRTQDVILSAASKIKKKRTALIYGAALCRDIPLIELSQQFKQLILVDLFHPPWAKKSDLQNVQCLNHDVTGLLETVHGLWGDDLPPVPVPDKFLDDPEIDFVVSANIASQLPLMPCNWLHRHHLHNGTPRYGDDEIKQFGRQIVEAHFNHLRQFKAQVCLICDVQRLEKTRQGEREIDNPLFGISLPEPSEIWDWKLRPKRDTWGRKEIIHRVAAFKNWS